jgi:cytochrome c oxidase subunit 3
MEQQKESATLGMWSFLITELMLFGGVFMAYIVYRFAYPEQFAAGSGHLDWPLAAVNTVVLLVSSLTVAMAVHAAEKGNKTRIIQMLILTMVLGVGFLGIKGYEYAEKFAHCAGAHTVAEWVGGVRHEVEECLVPGRAFIFPSEEAHSGAAAHGGERDTLAGVNPQSPSSVVLANQGPWQLFYLLYFTATGLHAFHMIVGLTIMTVLLIMTQRNRFDTEYFTPIEMGGLYWHLIDIIWVFLFPLFYLVH